MGAGNCCICQRIQYRNRQLVGWQLTAKLVRAGPWASMYLTTAAPRNMGQGAARRSHGLSYTVGWVLRYIKPPRPAPPLHVGIFVQESGKPKARGPKQKYCVASSPDAVPVAHVFVRYFVPSMLEDQIPAIEMNRRDGGVGASNPLLHNLAVV